MMRVVMRLVIMQILGVILLIPMNVKSFDGQVPSFDQRSMMPPRSDSFAPNQNDSSNSMRLDNRPSMMSGNPNLQQMNNSVNHSTPANFSPPTSDNTVGKQNQNMPTHVVSGLDTDFSEQQSVDEAVDTINAKSGGNWLLKRVWWEKTEEVYEQIKEVFNHVMDMRMQFISEFNKLNRSLDIFYSEIGIEQGPLRDLLSHAQDLMDKEEKEQGYLDKKEQAFVRKLRGKERDLEQLKLDIKAIQLLDNKLDEAFEMLFKQIDVCNQYEQKAWNNFKEIARELNDKEARKLYYDTEGLYKDIQKVSEYISGSFNEYFNQAIQSAHDHTEKISAQMNALKNDGINLVKEAEILEKEDDEQELKTKEEAHPKTIKKGWWYALGDRFGRFIDSIIGLFPKSLVAWFSKEKKQVNAEYDKLKKEGEQEYADAQEEIRTIGADIKDEVNTVEQDLGFAQAPQQQYHVAPRQASNNHVRPQQHTLPAFPEPHFEDSFDEKPRIDPTLAPMQHRPTHTPEARRNVTDHFEQSRRPEDNFHVNQPDRRNHNVHMRDDRKQGNPYHHPRPPYPRDARMNVHDSTRLEHASSDATPLHVDR